MYSCNWAPKTYESRVYGACPNPEEREPIYHEWLVPTIHSDYSSSIVILYWIPLPAFISTQHNKGGFWFPDSTAFFQQAGSHPSGFLWIRPKAAVHLKVHLSRGIVSKSHFPFLSNLPISNLEFLKSWVISVPKLRLNPGTRSNLVI